MALNQRAISPKLLDALLSSPTIFLNGPRQAGKSTLVHALSKKEFPAEYVTFDSTTQMAAAAHAPEEFLKQRQGALIIDEVQLVPEIFRSLKVVIDERRLTTPANVNGQFLLTGSANIMALPKLADPLVGRMSILTLYPFSTCEALKKDSHFIDNLFTQSFKNSENKDNLLDMIRKATFPEISGKTLKARTRWFDGYITTILQRDVRALSEIEKLSVLPNLLRIIASRAGSLINDADISRDAGLNIVTSRNYKTLLRMLFLTIELPPWYRNIGKRLVKAKKGYIIDTLLLCHLLQYELGELEKQRPEIFGHVLENFVATELTKLISHHNDNLSLFHFRTSDNKEVDFIIEKPNGKLVGIEVKMSESVSAKDFKGLEVLKESCSDDVQCGIVLYRGREVVPFGKKLWAVPISNLWG